MDKLIYKYYDIMIKKYITYKKTSYAQIITKLYYSTHLKGPHIDFFNSPHSLNKKELFDNLKKFQKQIIISIGNLIDCEKVNCYLNSKVVEAMINQIKTIDNISNNYWENFGFIDTDIEIIRKTYQIYALFLETYLIKISKNNTQIKQKLYRACIFEQFGSNIDPLKLQLFGIKKIKELVEKINKSVKSIKSIKSNVIESDSKLFSLTMTNILKLYNDNNDNNNNNKRKNIIFLEPHKVKIKQMSLLIEKYNFSSFVSGRNIFINDLNPQMYTNDDIMLLCAHDSINGIMTTKINVGKKIQKYIKMYFKNNKKDKKFKHDIVNMFINLPYYNEGLACLSEQYVVPYLDNELSLLSKQLIRAVSMVVDIGLHCDNPGVHMSFNIESAKLYIKNITNLSDVEINAILLTILASPASLCTQEFANHVMSNQKIEIETMMKYNNFYDIIYDLPFNVTAMTNFLSELKKFENVF